MDKEGFAREAREKFQELKDTLPVGTFHELQKLFVGQDQWWNEK